MITPEEAAAKLCPFARTFSAKVAIAGCQGPVCMLWRFEKITTAHPNWQPAVLKQAAQSGEKAPYSKAAAYVAAHMAELGMVPVRGFCGAGAAP